MMKSASTPHFTPLWADPHFKHQHHAHPDYVRSLSQQSQGHQGQDQGYQGQLGQSQGQLGQSQAHQGQLGQSQGQEKQLENPSVSGQFVKNDNASTQRPRFTEKY